MVRFGGGLLPGWLVGQDTETTDWDARSLALFCSTVKCYCCRYRPYLPSLSGVVWLGQVKANQTLQARTISRVVLMPKNDGRPAFCRCAVWV